MAWTTPDFITLSDLGIAYRKAKADVFYERAYPYMQTIADYEDNLVHNLRRLYKLLQDGDLSWMSSQDFVGSWSVIPKSIELPTPDTQDTDKNGHCLYSEPDEQWKQATRRGKPIAEFRQIGRHSMDFHVISALWILKVGHIYDAALGPEAYGARLRRCHQEDPEELGEINTLSLGCFKPYLAQYRAWRENGLTSMTRGLEEGKRVIAVTADVRQFYHRLSPCFLVDDAYLTAVGLAQKIKPDHLFFTQGMISAIQAWAQRTPLHRRSPEVGVPVGLSASRIIANVALAELDKAILRELQPLYYGRYVDDIILVLDDTHGLTSLEDIWKFIEKRLGGLLEVAMSEDFRVVFAPKYLGNSELWFMGKKQRTFILQGESGKVLVESIRHQVNMQSSEWRMLPELLENPEDVATSIMAACGDDGDAVDNLRKTDALSISRAGFAIRLRDFEAFEQDLEADAWAKHRKVFFSVICRHFIALPKLFDFASYLPRLFGLAIACRDYDAATQIIERIQHCLSELAGFCKITLAGNTAEDRIFLAKWTEYLHAALRESLTAALDKRHEDDTEQLESLLTALSADFGEPVSIEGMKASAKKWFIRDLGRRPYRMLYFPYGRDQLWEYSNIAQTLSNELYTSGLVTSPPADDLRSFINKLVNNTTTDDLFSSQKEIDPTLNLPDALLFPTRPFSVGEIFLLAPTSFSDADNVQKWTLAFRGFKAVEDLPSYRDETNILSIKLASGGDPVRVALGCLKTATKSWNASVVRMPEPDLTRYGRINRLVNSVLSSPLRPSYLLLPELSIPARWFDRIANKCVRRGISFIAGVEYLHHGPDKVANQVWASLLTDFVGFTLPIIYRQDKAAPALHEESELWRIGEKTLEPLFPPTAKGKPVLHHGSLYFAILVCSELTNIEYRWRLRGKVDMVMVPEWNQDIETFGTLVESSALDIHAFIVQCNNRDYGDSRIRVPAKDAWQRDLVRIKGGMEDYYVIGEVDIKSLRQSQSAARSNNADMFKPVPDGFVISDGRRVLPI